MFNDSFTNQQLILLLLVLMALTPVVRSLTPRLAPAKIKRKPTPLKRR